MSSELFAALALLELSLAYWCYSLQQGSHRAMSGERRAMIAIDQLSTLGVELSAPFLMKNIQAEGLTRLAHGSPLIAHCSSLATA